MEVGGIGTSGGVGTTARRDLNSLQSEDFFKLLVTELQQQDPLEPSKTEDMIGQVSRIRSIEQSEALNQSLRQMANQQRTAGASDLLNKYVMAEAADAAGNVTETAGVVTGVRFGDDGTALLDLDNGLTVRAQDVKNVTTPENVDAVTMTAGDNGTAKVKVTTKPNAAKTFNLLDTPLFKLSLPLQ